MTAEKREQHQDRTIKKKCPCHMTAAETLFLKGESAYTLIYQRLVFTFLLSNLFTQLPFNELAAFTTLLQLFLQEALAVFCNVAASKDIGHSYP